MELKRLQELAGIQSLYSSRNVESSLLTEADNTKEDKLLSSEQIEKTADKITSFKPKLYAQEIKNIFTTSKDEKKLQKALLKYFKEEVIPDTKRNLFSPIIISPNNPRVLILVIEEPERTLIIRELLYRLATELKNEGILLSIKIDSKDILKDFMIEPMNKKKYTFELLLNTDEEVKAAKQGAKQEREAAANPKSDKQLKVDEEKNYTEVEEIFKRTMKHKHPHFNNVKVRDKVVEEYFDKVVTTMHILGQFHNAGPAVINNINETYKGQDIKKFIKDIEDLQAVIKECEDKIKSLVVPAAEEYVKSR